MWIFLKIDTEGYEYGGAARRRRDAQALQARDHRRAEGQQRQPLRYDDRAALPFLEKLEHASWLNGRETTCWSGAEWPGAAA